jgi:hypothetical protein
MFSTTIQIFYFKSGFPVIPTFISIMTDATRSTTKPGLLDLGVPTLLANCKKFSGVCSRLWIRKTLEENCCGVHNGQWDSLTHTCKAGNFHINKKVNFMTFNRTDFQLHKNFHIKNYL